MSEYQKKKMQKNQMGPRDFLIHKQDEKGIKHSFFDFKKFSNFIEEEDEEMERSGSDFQKNGA